MTPLSQEGVTLPPNPHHARQGQVDQIVDRPLDIGIRACSRSRAGPTASWSSATPRVRRARDCGRVGVSLANSALRV
jgi:hypothetical protein